MKRIFIGLVCVLLIGHLVQSQSIYSFQGLGSLNHQGMPNNVGNGEVGIGSPTIWHINTQNPANLIYNTFSTFQLGIVVDRRQFSGEDLSGEATEGGLRFLGYAFPILPGKWSSSFGILPYSSVSYNTFSEGEVAGSGGTVNQISDNRGEGGLTNFYWSNGFKIMDKLLVGVRTNYTFGSILKTSTISIGGEDLPTSNVTYEELEAYSDVNFLFGIGYRHTLTEKSFVNFGATFSPRSPLNGTSELSLIRLSSSGSELETIEVGSTDITFDLPRTYGIGVSYQKLNHYMIGMDMEAQAWGNAGSGNTLYNNSLKISLGGELTPDFDNVNSYWKRVKYSGGLNYHKLPYIVNNQALTDFGINFGASLPVSGYSSLDLAFKWGQLGETTNGLIKETYYKVVIGATINDRWFIKRKYD
ncbi:hypothetical protein [Ekhidna sp.]|uniref:hypothetical protein n=1 Tax=Ekhidna sp. TaxID=2608089 RepID=UPI003BAADC8B